jgi:hypothetical protein
VTQVELEKIIEHANVAGEEKALWVIALQTTRIADSLDELKKQYEEKSVFERVFGTKI